ncbi:quorum-sensing sensor histidine kinase AgrC [Staphylococcus kloosii]|jgi:two-component system sensor histidine kinase AgrC|uniref:GHKL domain-containing protein n=1 Tax=Staphylococcus kloosii TaxID=29384 RepID=A0A921KWJ0_9STAP|nr:GHKL domain-containing protein [Staphylococcus kloosii]AVQ35681.1 GHKL domain-containing protein [Staphylococcus kloosii]MBF7021622.1 GHKL domain-containing protein [Staphylococcus kloosii]MBF7030864.1 GHKL domain-containing protein [Staphylococcus kloosii]PNZ06236.1 ATP-binding protein [Staphylococcus kloosii]PTJ78762.1 GHKL domain-containing protein [Staphylococcus kloosii]
MTFLNSIYISIYQLIVLFGVIKIIGNVTYKTRDYISILGIVIPSTLLYFIFSTRIILILIVFTLIFMYIRNKFLGLIFVVLTFLLLYISNFFSVWTMALLKNYNLSSYLMITIYIVVFTIIALFLAIITRYFIKKLSHSILSLNKVYLTLIGIILLATFLILYLYMPKEVISYGDFKYLSVIYVILIIIIAILIITVSFSIVREVQYKRNMQEIENYYKYTLQIEQINNEMRKFRHDYVNILSTMSDYIRENDMEGLRNYFTTEILPMQDNMQMNAVKINGIENLKIREIKGLVTTKILQAQEMNISISVEVNEQITKIDMPTIDLSRIIGIIIDNAIEASENIDEDPLIRIAFLKNSDVSVTFIVMNKCEDDIPRVHTLFQENFTTKKGNSGLGLSTLKEITESKSNLLLDTTIENNYFVQKVEILNT